MAEGVDPRRTRVVHDGNPGDGPVIYWTTRDQRAQDNWALLWAQDWALHLRKPLGVVFCLPSSFLEAAGRQYSFMLSGLEETERRLRQHHIPLFLLIGRPDEALPQFVRRHGVSLVVADFFPLRIHRQWVDKVADIASVPFHQVDAHNIVPAWQTTGYQEFSARTFRPKIRKLLPTYLTEFPKLRRHPFAWPDEPPLTDWNRARRTSRVDPGVTDVQWLSPGANAANRMLRRFIDRRLPWYHERHNDPALHGQSDLSPYLHFGQISAQRVALEVQKHDPATKSQETFLENLIVRRELSDNFCWCNPRYDSFEGLPEWARLSLNQHRTDPRTHLYNREQFEQAMTHDELWNAAQKELVLRGKLHGYVRMYWAKKMLEWSRSPEEAQADAIYLNDRYGIDGRDPNGYTNIAWCIGGLHDRPFPERDIFGKIRYMSYGGCKQKFDVDTYVAWVDRLYLGEGI